MADWDCDYDIIYELHHYTCPTCLIKCRVNTEGYRDKETWDIPERFRMSLKQEKTVKFIEDVLGTDGNCHTKKQSWEFTNKYFNNAKQQADCNFSCWCEDNQDWLPEYY